MPSTSEILQNLLHAFVLSVASFPCRAYGLLLAQEDPYSLSNLLGLSNEEEINFLLGAGLIKRRGQNGSLVIVNEDSLDRFVASFGADERIAHNHARLKELGGKNSHFLIIGQGFCSVNEQFKKDAKPPSRLTPQHQQTLRGLQAKLRSDLSLPRIPSLLEAEKEEDNNPNEISPATTAQASPQRSETLESMSLTDFIEKFVNKSLVVRREFLI